MKDYRPQLGSKVLAVRNRRGTDLGATAPDVNGKNQIAAARIEISSAVFQK
jgi:hypothetical protein